MERGAGFFLRVEPSPVVVVDLHVETPRSAGDSLTDSAHSDDAEPFARHVRAKQLSRGPGRPLATTHQPVAFARAPCRGKHQQQRNIGCRVREDAGCVRDHKPAPFGGLEIDMVKPDRKRGHDVYRGGQRINQRGVETFRARCQDAVAAHRAGRQFAAGENIVGWIVANLECLARAALDGVGISARQHYLWSVWHQLFDSFGNKGIGVGAVRPDISSIAGTAMAIDGKDMRMVRSSLHAAVLGVATLGPVTSLQAAEIALYDAIYTVTADSASAGQIRQRLGRECREWVYSQNAEFTMPDNQLVAWETATRESMDATEYHFDMTTRNDGSVERLQGTAVMNAYSGRAIFGDPDRTVLRMEPETLFPTQFTSELIEHAEAGNRYFSVPVFSGIDGRRVLRVTAVIGDPFEAPQAGTTASLLAHPGWPITLAYFDDVDAGLEYQIDVDLLDNGVARSLDIRSDEMLLSVRLTDIETVAPEAC